MRGLNRVQLIGNVGGEPEVKYTDQGTARTTFSVAVNRQWNDTEGHTQQETEWFAVVTWGALAEIAGEHVTKGKRLYVEGRLHTHSWTVDDTGEKRSRTEVIAQELILLGSRDAQGDREAEGDPETPAPSGIQQGSADTRAQPRRRRKASAPPSSSDPDWDALGV